MAQEELDWYSRHAKKSAQQIADAAGLVLIVTDGPASIHDYRLELPSLSVIPPRVDTTGASDSFCVALLAKMGQIGDSCSGTMAIGLPFASLCRKLIDRS